MSDHSSTYQPSNGFTRWLDERLPILRMMHGNFIDFPTPRNLNYFWTFGGILTFCLMVQLITGIVLAMHFVAHGDHAFQSVEHIMRDVNWGDLIRYTHAVGASMFFFAAYIHMFRGLYYGSYKSPREILWILGVMIILDDDHYRVYGLLPALGANELLGGDCDYQSFHRDPGCG